MFTAEGRKSSEEMDLMLRPCSLTLQKARTIECQLSYNSSDAPGALKLEARWSLNGDKV